MLSFKTQRNWVICHQLISPFLSTVSPARGPKVQTSLSPVLSFTPPTDTFAVYLWPPSFTLFAHPLNHTSKKQLKSTVLQAFRGHCRSPQRFLSSAFSIPSTARWKGPISICLSSRIAFSFWKAAWCSRKKRDLIKHWIRSHCVIVLDDQLLYWALFSLSFKVGLMMYSGWVLITQAQCLRSLRFHGTWHYQSFCP